MKIIQNQTKIIQNHMKSNENHMKIMQNQMKIIQNHMKITQNCYSYENLECAIYIFLNVAPSPDVRAVRLARFDYKRGPDTTPHAYSI